MNSYNNFGIYELREFARRLGVKAPTTFKRAELIEKIKAIESGKEKPCVDNKRQGRPVKKFEFVELSSENTVEIINLFEILKQKNIETNKQIEELINKLKI